MIKVQNARETVIQVRESGIEKNKDCGCDRADNRQQPISGEVPIMNEFKNRPK